MEAERHPVFISHATPDDPFVRELRTQLEAHGVRVWVDSRNLRGGQQLDPEVEKAIRGAGHVLAVLSPQTVNSSWVRREIRLGLEVAAQHSDNGYAVTPLMLPGIEPSALEIWFDEEPVGIRVDPERLAESMAAILAALGKQAPPDPEAAPSSKQKPIADLVLELEDPTFRRSRGTRKLSATATLTYQPPVFGAREVKSRRFTLTAPLGPIEADDLRWYLEQYHLWPVGVFQERAARIENSLADWGRALYDAALSHADVQKALRPWLDCEHRRFSIEIDPDPPTGAGNQEQASCREAATALMALPWELLHDGRTFLFHGKKPVRVRRRLPNRHSQPAPQLELPIRILVVSPRPGDVGYFDHRSSALPLVEAVEGLGDLAEVTVLAPPTLQALEDALATGTYHVVHFDGHGVYDKRHGLGCLCFEKADTPDKTDTVTSKTLAGIVREHRIPVVFLDACQGARADLDISGSVAAGMLAEGVTSVVAMTHSILIPTAEKFVAAFYRRLAEGSTVGAAMLAGQRALCDDPYRMDVVGAGRLELQDWFVPVLFQEENDPQLFRGLPSGEAARLQGKQRDLRLGDLPDTPAHSFIGRSRELLHLERRLAPPLHAAPKTLSPTARSAVIRGVGGVGKTTIAAEFARWLVRSGRVRRAAFVTLETMQAPRAVLDTLGRQLLPDYSVAPFGDDLEAARQPIDRALRDDPTILVVDNCESVAERSGFSVQCSGEDSAEIRGESGASKEDSGEPHSLNTEHRTLNTPPSPFPLFETLLREAPATRVVFTSRSSLPAPFTRGLELGNLCRDDAVDLVGKVLKELGLEPKPGDDGRTPEEIDALVIAVHGHPRALVLLAREIAARGVNATTADLAGLMADLERKNPGDRENSLYASVELSLRRLPDDLRKKVDALAPFHGCADFNVYRLMTECSEEDALRVSDKLVAVGLAEQAAGRECVTLDPALAPYLRTQMDDETLTTLTDRWAEAMIQLVGFLYEQLFKDANMSRRLTLLELPNLLALLDWLPSHREPPDVVATAGRIEQLLADLGRPAALARAVAVREAAAEQLGDGNHAAFASAAWSIERLLEANDLRQARDTACELRTRCLAAGEDAYPGADSDIASACALLGRVLKKGGAASAALEPLTEAQRRFEAIPDNDSAARMAAVCLAEQGDCLRDLGRLDDAEAAYDENIRRAEKLEDTRQQAVGKAQLGTLLTHQGRYDEALAAHEEARDIFSRLREPGSVATAWHQIGRVHQQAGRHESAERAYRQSLAIEVPQGNRAGEASTLNQLGTLCAAMDRTEEAVTLHRQAADINARPGAQLGEGGSRSNSEPRSAIECKKPYGHAAEPWKTWNILHDLELATGNPTAATAARAEAIRLFHAYRRDGGENHMQSGLRCRQALSDISENRVAEALRQQKSMPDQPLARALVSILEGNRAPSLADDPALHYSDAVELRLLLESLGVPFPTPANEPEAPPK